MQTNFCSIFLLLCLPQLGAQALSYPPSRQASVVDTFFGVAVNDPYRWLEDAQSDEVTQWVAAQNNLSERQLRVVRSYANAADELNQIVYAEYDLPVKKGSKYYDRAYFSPNKPPGLYVRKSLTATPKLLLSPSMISKKDQITIDNFEVSKSEAYLAYSFSRNGSDWREIKVLDEKGKHLADHLVGVKHSGIVWQGNGFYYNQYPQNQDLSQTRDQTVYYHQIGTDQSEDKIVFRKTAQPFNTFEYIVSSDQRYFLLIENVATTGHQNLYIGDPQDAGGPLVPLLSDVNTETTPLDILDGLLYAMVLNAEDNSRSLVRCNLQSPGEWEEVIPEFDDAILLDCQLLKDKILCVYQTSAGKVVGLYSYEGRAQHLYYFTIDLNVEVFRAEMTDEELIFYYSSFVLPPIVCRMNINTYKLTIVKKTRVWFDVNKFTCAVRTYVARDGVQIPIYIAHLKDLKQNGKNPTLLEAYGGFGLVSSPHFNPELVEFLQRGGVFAFAFIRGGGEKGKAWAAAGRGMNKQTCFNDFQDAAGFLIAEQYTSPQRLAITGGSHGGLVVGAAITQRPDLFAVAVPEVGVFDMLRKELYTVGGYNRAEFGSVQVENSFHNLYAYSPLHNIREGVNYPTILLITAENDDRVPPFHSYKFAAALQQNPGQKNPVYLHTIKKAGHQGGATAQARMDQNESLFAFVWYYLQRRGG